MTSFIKDPDALLDYTVDWEKFLDGDTIFSSSWIVPTGLNQVVINNTDTTVTVFIDGGVLNTSYEITNRMTSAAGRIDDRTFILTIKEK